jgi:predicted nucleic acid-binding protein
MKLLIDSAALLALYDRGDKYHLRAKRAFQSLSEEKVTFIVTDYLVAEATTLILGRAGHLQAVICGDWLLNLPRVRLLRVEVDVWNEAWQLFKKYDDKEFSFVDCASFIVMRREHLVDAFTFDRHFEQMGFRLWPGLK